MDFDHPSYSDADERAHRIVSIADCLVSGLADGDEVIVSALFSLAARDGIGPQVAQMMDLIDALG